MKRRWLITPWLLALLALAGWAGLPSASVSTDCCCETQVELLCACGCQIAPLHAPASQPQDGAVLSTESAHFPSAVVVLPRPAAELLAVASPPAPSPRELDALGGHADWRGPPLPLG